MKRSSSRSAPASTNSDDFRRVFVRRVHQLIRLGYGRMNPATYRSAEEPTITGDLVLAIDNALDDPSSARWVQFYSVHDDPPVSARRRTGKRRRRVDIRFDCSERRPRTRFSFEAKRLDAKHGAGAYLGRDGLGCFVRGEYGRDEDEGGMLGYVQSNTPAGWATRIEAQLQRFPNRDTLVKTSPWRQEVVARGLRNTYRSGHRRKRVGRPIEIYHTLLSFQ